MTVSTTGVATPSLDALLVERMGLRRDIKRLPIFGFGCAGGVIGLRPIPSRRNDRMRSEPRLAHRHAATGSATAVSQRAVSNTHSRQMSCARPRSTIRSSVDISGFAASVGVQHPNGCSESTGLGEDWG